MRTLITLFIAAFFAHAAHAQNAFTYQGELKDNGNPVNATKTLRFVLFDDDSNPTPVESLGEHQVEIVDGLFTIELNPTISMGNDLYLEITVVDAMEYVLSPRQRITYAPKSLYSLTTRGIHVGQFGFVGINTTSPGARLEVRTDKGESEMLRLGSPESTTELRFFADASGATIQAFETDLTRISQLKLNPLGGLIQLNTQGLRFSDGSTLNAVPTPILIGFVGQATRAVEQSTVPGGGSLSFSTSVPGAMPGDMVIAYTENALSNHFVMHNARVPFANTVTVKITNTNTDEIANLAEVLQANTIRFKVLRH